MSPNQRRLRFSSIRGLDRNELPIAAEVWLNDMRGQIWITRDILKLATHLTRYINASDPNLLSLGLVERNCAIDAKQVKECLRMMRVYGAVDAYSCEDDSVRASLHLSYIQRLKVLEIRHKFGVLSGGSGSDDLPWCADQEDPWLEESPPQDEVVEPGQALAS